MQQLTVYEIGAANKAQVLRHIIQSGGCSRASIVGATGLSMMTVKKAVDGLLERGVVQHKKINTAVGRKPEWIEPSETMGVVICIDLSSPVECNAICYAPGGQVLGEHTCHFTETETYEEILRPFFADIKNRAAHIMGIGVSVGGAYSESTDRVPSTYIHQYKNVMVKQFVQECFGTPHITVAHDVHVAAQNEAALRGTQSLLYLFFGPGVGSSFIVEGKTVLGLSQTAGETGSFLLADGQTLNDVASTLRIARKTGAANFGALWKQFEAGEEMAVRVIDAACAEICRHIFNLVYFANPEYVVVDSDNKDYAQQLAQAASRFCTENMGNGALPIQFCIEPSLNSGKSVFAGLYITVLEEFLHRA